MIGKNTKYLYAALPPLRMVPRGEFAPLEEISIPQIIVAALNLLLIFAAVAFFFQLVLGGLKMILSMGKKERMDAAVRQIKNAIIGFVIVLSSWAIAGFIEQFFGVNILSFQIPTI